MADAAAPAPRAPLPRVWIAVGAILALLALLDPGMLRPAVAGTVSALLHTAPFIAFAVLSVAYMRAAGAEGVVARAFEGREGRMIVLAALAGGLSPFCSCEVIPFIAALLAMGAPLGAVMAFWLSSPLMDPAMFAITAGTLGVDFAAAKTVAAVAIGLAGGTATAAIVRAGGLRDVLKPEAAPRGCGCGPSPFERRPVWRFWREPARRASFRETALENGHFLLKWLTLAYLIEMLMLAYVPAELVGAVLGGEGFRSVLLGALIGGPAYLNGYAAVPLIDAMMAQGMSAGAAMSFMIAGGVSCIPAAVAVWALVRGRVFALYLGLAFIGSLGAGLTWGAIS